MLIELKINYITMKINNLILKEEAEKWMIKSPSYLKLFEIFSSFISIVDVISEIYQFKEQDLRDFIVGLIPLYLCNSTDNYNAEKKSYLENESTRLSRPVMDKVVEHFKSNSYKSYLINQQITGEAMLEIDGVKEVINEKAISQHIKRLNINPLTVKEIEDVEWSYIRYKRNLYRDPIVNFKNENKIKIDIPVIDREKYDSDKIYDKFCNKVFECSKDCFNAWLVHGNIHHEKIKCILKGRKSRKTGEETLNFAQLRKFIEKITGNSENTKDAYYKTVFGLTIKCSTIKTSNQFKLYKKLEECKIKKK